MTTTKFDNMKNLNHTTATKLIASIVLILLTLTSTAQNWWQSAQLKSANENNSNCPVYNADDPEINIEYQYALGGEGDNAALDIAFAPDSNFIILYRNNGYKFAKYNQSGEQLWVQKLMVNDTTEFNARQFIAIGEDYYIAGSWGLYGRGNYGIIKTDANGNTKWLKRLYNDTSTQKYLNYRNPTIINVEENYFLLSTEVNKELYVAKFDSTCSKLWEVSNTDLNHHGGSRNFRVQYVQNQYLIYLIDQYWFLNYDSEITKNESLHSGYHVRIYDEGDKLYSCGDDYPIQWIRKYSLDFNLEKEYTQPEIENQRKISSAVTIKELTNGSVLAYYDYEYPGFDGYSEYNVQLLHLNNNLECKSTINLYAPGSQYANKLLLTNNNSYILFGHGYHDYSKRNMLFLTKLNSLPVSVQTKQATNDFSVYPNPANSLITIRFNKTLTGNLAIYNSLGKKVYNKKVENKTEETYDISSLSKGLYLLQFNTNANKYLKQIIIE